MAAALAALLVSIACVAPAGGPAASPAAPTAAVTIPAPTASVPLPPPAPSPAPGAAPVSASVAPDAGVLYLIGADDAIYRYDGASGRLDPVWRVPTRARARDGGARRRRRPAPQGILRAPRWSPDGGSALVLRIGTTSNSFAADGAETATLLVDIGTGRVSDLGVVLNSGWAVWGPGGSLAYVRGGGRMTWENKTPIG